MFPKLHLGELSSGISSCHKYIYWFILATYLLLSICEEDDIYGQSMLPAFLALNLDSLVSPLLVGLLVRLLLWRILFTYLPREEFIPRCHIL